MVRPGYFTLPRHDPSLVRDLIRDTQPSAIKYWVSSTSAEQVKEWARLSPNTIMIQVDGSVGDSGEKFNLIGADLRAMAQRHAAKYAYWRSMGYLGAAMTFNEPPIWDGRQYRKALNEYTCYFLEEAHARGLNCCIFNFSVGWPHTWLDNDSWWPEFRDAVNLMRPGDFIGLHEYWNSNGPLASWPWLAGRHCLCPYDKDILISECGIDQATIPGQPHDGWRKVTSPENYVAQLVQYHRELDRRVKGTAIFLLDYENNQWDSFDIRYCADQIRQATWEGPKTIVIPNKVEIEGSPQIVSTYTAIIYLGNGTKVKSPVAGTVYRIEEQSVWINAKWGSLKFDNVVPLVALQKEVSPGEVIGTTGKSSYFLTIQTYGEERNIGQLLGISSNDTPSYDLNRTERIIGNELQKHVIPLNPEAYFEKQASKFGYLPASKEVDVNVDGKLYRAQVYRHPSRRDKQYIIYAPVGDWAKARWFERKN